MARNKPIKLMQSVVCLILYALCIACNIFDSSKTRIPQSEKFEQSQISVLSKAGRFDEAVENLTRKLKNKSHLNRDYQVVYSAIFNQKSLAEMLIRSCDEDLSPSRIEIQAIHQISEDRLVLQVLCSVGVNTPFSKLFLYRKQNNQPQVEPVKILAARWPTKDSQAVFEQTTTVVGFIKFDLTGQEFSVTQNCTAGYRQADCGVISTYKLENDQFVLKKVLADLKDDGALRYGQVYP
jgi:hypothetical protein